MEIIYAGESKKDLTTGVSYKVIEVEDGRYTVRDDVGERNELWKGEFIIVNDKPPQSKKDSLIEVLSNQIIGIIGGWLIVYFLFPLFDNLPQEQIATVSTVIFFAWSSLRSYVLRRFFNNRNK